MRRHEARPAAAVKGTPVGRRGRWRRAAGQYKQIAIAAAGLNRVRRPGTERMRSHRVRIPKRRGRVAEEYRIRYRDPSGRELVSLPKPTVAGAIRHARVIEEHHGTVLAIVGPDGDLSWDEVSALAEVMLKPPVG